MSTQEGTHRVDAGGAGGYPRARMNPPPGYVEVRRPDLVAWAKGGLVEAAIEATEPDRKSVV